jgi:hypothetical protein
MISFNQRIVRSFAPAWNLTVLIVLVMASTANARAHEVLYFPKGAEHWYPKYLEVMREPSLFQQPTNNSVEQYRFLWLRTFHRPIAVRIWKDGSEAELRVVRLSGAGGYDPGHIERDDSFSITDKQWSHFLGLLNESSFWNFQSAESYLGGFDGSQWILEGRAADKYHVVDRWAPLSNGKERHLEKFVACCRYLLKLSKEKIPRKDDY